MAIRGYNFYLDGVKVNSLPQTNPTYTFTSLPSGTSYEITAEAVDNAGNISDLSDPLDAATLSLEPDDEMVEADRVIVDALAAETMGSAKGVLVSISGPRGSYTKAYGNDYTSTGAAGRALTVDDKMHYGSTTKMNVAVLICRQIDLGNLSFDDTLDMFATTTGVTNGNIITIRMLLENRTGIVEVVDAASAYGQQSYLTPTAVAPDFMTYVRGAASSFPPDSRYAYCNTNWLLLGEILRQVDIDHGTGRSVADIVRQDCYDALDLTESEWRTSAYMTPPYSRGWNDNAAYATIAGIVNSLPLAWLLGSYYWSLVPSLSGGWPATPTYEFTAYDPSWPGTAGCLDGTISDLRKFGEKLRDGELLSPEMIQLRAETFPSTYAAYEKAYVWDGPGWIGAGLGLMCIGDWRGWNGASAGYSSALWYNVANGAVIAVMHNYFGLTPFSLMLKIAYELWPESLDHNPDKVIRPTPIPSGESFGNTRIFRWAPPGDADGTTELPHKIPCTV